MKTEKEVRKEGKERKKNRDAESLGEATQFSSYYSFYKIKHWLLLQPWSGCVNLFRYGDDCFAILHLGFFC